MEAYDENGERLVFRKGHYARKARKGKAKESDNPVPLSDTDPRVVRDLEPEPAPVVETVEAVEPVVEPEPEQPTTTAERVLTIEEAEALVQAGTHAWDIDDSGNRFVRELERNAQQGAADEIALADNGGVMRTERAD